MEPSEYQVKPARFRSLAALLLLATAAVAAPGCAEGRAARLYDEAQELVDQGEIGQAIERYETILARFPDPEAAVLARNDIDTYRSLADAVERYPVRSAFDLMVGTARAIERFRSRNREYPETLAALVPGYLEQAPVDPWGRALVYSRRAGRKGYVLACLGSDGAAGGTDDAKDLVVQNGRFVARPTGMPL